MANVAASCAISRRNVYLEICTRDYQNALMFAGLAFPAGLAACMLQGSYLAAPLHTGMRNRLVAKRNSRCPSANGVRSRTECMVLAKTLHDEANMTGGAIVNTNFIC